MCPWEFSWNFCDFRSIFRVFKQILGFSGIVFALKIISKKKKIYPIYLGRARRPDPGPHRPSRRPARVPSKPAGAHRPAAVHGGHAAAASCLGRARPGLLQPRPTKPCAELLRTLAGCASPCFAPPPDLVAGQPELAAAGPRFAACVDLRAEPAPPGAPQRRAAPSQPLPVAGSTPEHHRRMRPPSAVTARRRRPSS
jgi:hypothetical protein